MTDLLTNIRKISNKTLSEIEINHYVTMQEHNIECLIKFSSNNAIVKKIAQNMKDDLDRLKFVI